MKPSSGLNPSLWKRLRRWNKGGEDEALLFGADCSARAYDEYPELEPYSPEELRTAIIRARLSPNDAQIAIGRLIWRSKWVNIGAVVNMDRTAAQRRLKNKIIPKILANLQLCRKIS